MRAVNLIPSEQRSDGSVGTRSEGAAFIVLGLLAGVAILAGLYGLARHRVASRSAQVAALTAEAQQAQARAQALAPYASFMAMREQRLQAVSQLIGDRFDWAHALHELGRVLPYNASLSSVQGTIGTTSGSAASAAPTSALTTASSASAKTTASASVASATPPGATPTLTIAGCAVSQSEVARTLVRLHQIDGVANVVLQSSTKSGASSGAGNCPSGDPTFSVQVTFQPLPSPAALNPGAFGTATPTSATGGAATPSKATISTASAGSAR